MGVLRPLVSKVTLPTSLPEAAHLVRKLRWQETSLLHEPHPRQHLLSREMDLPKPPIVLYTIASKFVLIEVPVTVLGQQHTLKYVETLSERHLKKVSSERAQTLSLPSPVLTGKTTLQS